MHKDEITGEEVIDYDFLGKKLYPPKKLKMTDAGKERLRAEMVKFGLLLEVCHIAIFYLPSPTGGGKILLGYF